MAQHIFITGTDTDIGKTYVAVGLLRALANHGKITSALKPISSGCMITEAGLRNEDALQLQSAATNQFSYAEINPWAFVPPIAPYIAAEQMQKTLTVRTLINECQPVLQRPTDYIIMEGVGGWLQLLNTEETTADFVKALDFSVLMVVGMRLGCLNHALLTYRAIAATNNFCVGWVANCLDPKMLALNENINLLKNVLPIPCLGVIPYGAAPEDCLQLEKFLR